MQNSSIINDSFRPFYTDHNTPDQKTSMEEAETFLRNASPPKTNPNPIRNPRNTPLSGKKITRALHLMPNNKSPRPDGLSAEFSEQFWALLLSPLFLKVIFEIHQSSTIPHDMNSVYITLNLKPKKDPTHCSNYCPISLINTDTKIISKALSVRFESVLIMNTHRKRFYQGEAFLRKHTKIIQLDQFLQKQLLNQKAHYSLLQRLMQRRHFTG